MPHTIFAIRAFHDNYIWMIVHPETQRAIVVDPGDADPVIQTLKQARYQLAGILITHHHQDHTGGVHELCSHYDVPVFAPEEYKGQAPYHIVKQGDHINIPEAKLHFDVLSTPGHTLGHIAFVGCDGVFCGDTLFAGGCGRLFEGTAEQLHHSLTQLAALNPTTRVYCAHEYTAANLEFAKQVEPANRLLQERVEETELKRAALQPTLPSTIQLEQATNPFLRCHLPHIQQAVQDHFPHNEIMDTISTFAALRHWKDTFKSKLN